jgi:hypothetical protein
VAWLVLTLLMALSAALIWRWSTHATLRGDEWGYAYRVSVEPTYDYLFDPPRGKHLIAVPLLLYKAAFEGFGIGSSVPYRLAHIALLLLCAGLFYALVRRRVGDALAVLPTGILLFLGSAQEVVATPVRVPSLIAIAAGLAMLLALERRDLRGDVAACFLLAVSLASHSTSFAFAAAAAVLVLLRPAPERWRRSWVFALPILAYLSWWLVEFDAGPYQPLGSTIVETPAYVWESLVGTLRAASGWGVHATFMGLRIPAPMRVVLGAVLLALLGAFLVASVRRSRAISPFALAVAVALVTFWVATHLAPGAGRPPTEPRYLYPDAVLFLLLLCELARDFALPRRLTASAAIAILALFAVSIAGNFYELRDLARWFDKSSDRQRASLTALTVAGSAVPPQFNLAAALTGRGQASTHVKGLSAGEYSRVLADYGSPAYSPAELMSRPQPVRATADYVLLRATGSELRPTGSLPASHNPAPRGLQAVGGKWTTALRGCIELRTSDAAAGGMLSLPAGRLALAARAGPPVMVRAGGFAEGAPVATGSLRGGDRAVLDLPATHGVLGDWRVAIQAHQRVRACSAH